MTHFWWTFCFMTTASALAFSSANNISADTKISESTGFNVSDPPNPWTVVREPHTYTFLALPGQTTDHDYFTEVASRCFYDLIQSMHRGGRDTSQRIPGNAFGSSAGAGTLKFQLVDEASNKYPFNAYLMSRVIYDMDVLIYAYKSALPPLAFQIGFRENSHSVEKSVIHGTWLPQYVVLRQNHTNMALPETGTGTA